MSMLYGPVAVMPPQLAWWARTLELSMLSDELAMTARQYLSRFWELLPEVRDSLGERIASQVVAVVSPPPPPGCGPRSCCRPCSPSAATGRSGGWPSGGRGGCAGSGRRRKCRSRAGTRDGDGRARAVGAAAAGSAAPPPFSTPGRGSRSSFRRPTTARGPTRTS